MGNAHRQVAIVGAGTGRLAAPAAMIGADGVHSVVRDKLFGPERLHYPGRIAYRSTYPVSRLNG